MEYVQNSNVIPGADKSPRTVRATKLVILSAGAFGSPTILERSGIGANDVLQRNGIKQVVDLPGVGENYNGPLRMGRNLNSANSVRRSPPNFYTIPCEGGCGNPRWYRARRSHRIREYVSLLSCRLTFYPMVILIFIQSGRLSGNGTVRDSWQQSKPSHHSIIGVKLLNRALPSGIDGGMKYRPSEQELHAIGPEFTQRWADYYAGAPDKAILWTGQISA